MKLRALGSRAKLRRAGASKLFPGGRHRESFPEASGTVWCSLSDEQVFTVVFLSACLSACLAVSALLMRLSGRNGAPSPRIHSQAGGDTSGPFRDLFILPPGHRARF